MLFSFLFQAEDGIRDTSVTGVQTCALPISVPLRFRWQLLSGPTCIGARLSVTHIYGPIWRQREFIEHRAQEPLTVFATPEDWMCDVLLRLPIPVGIRPVVSMIVAAPCHELQKLTIRNFVLVDRERGPFR